MEQLKNKKWPLDVLNSLVELYEREKETYIEKWGYDAYENKYLDPDHDIYYYDKLDAKYEAEMQKMREKEQDEEEDYSENY